MASISISMAAIVWLAPPKLIWRIELPARRRKVGVGGVHGGQAGGFALGAVAGPRIADADTVPVIAGRA